MKTLLGFIYNMFWLVIAGALLSMSTHGLAEGNITFLNILGVIISIPLAWLSIVRINEILSEK